MKELRETNFKKLGKKRTGDVRDVYEQKDAVILVATDRHSSFDTSIAVPHKGQVVNQLSAFWFGKTKTIVPNHVLVVPDPNVTVAKKCKPLPVGAVVRGYMTGNAQASLWVQYQKGKRDFGNFKLQDGMRKNQQLLRPVFTPSMKSDARDRALSPQEIVNEGILSRKTIDAIQTAALALYARGSEIARERGLILVDAEYEFGVANGNGNGNGDIVLIGDVHTPDSSHYWPLDSYRERFEQGLDPGDAGEDLSRRYIRLYEQLTGEKFAPGAEPILRRIEKNLKRYAIA